MTARQAMAADITMRASLEPLGSIVIFYPGAASAVISMDTILEGPAEI